METEKLHLNDSFSLDFEARAVAAASWNGQPAALLDRSAFYAEAGGQLGDAGTLSIGGQVFRVTDTQYDDAKRHCHLLDRPLPEELVGAHAAGQVDFERRRDMMSQHTGQHLLSATFHKTLGAKTVSSRLGSTVSTLDLAIDPLTESQLTEVVDLANNLVLEDRAVRPLYPSDEALARMDLRRAPKVKERVRVLEIEGYDFTPCGGTHCARTGQIGPIHVIGRERYKGGARVTFLAGRRVLAHHRRQDATLAQLGEGLGCGAAGVPEAVVALQNELRERNQQLGETRLALMKTLCAELHRRHPPRADGPTPIVAVREQDDLASLRALAAALAKRADTVALVAGRDPKSGDWRVVLQRGEAADFNAGSWFRERGAALGGRGGGRPEKAEGRFPAAVDIAKVKIV